VVRNTKTLDEPIERTSDVSTSSLKKRAPRRSFVCGNPGTEDSELARIGARADADFERIFGSE
jgi:hypothetical protein